MSSSNNDGGIEQDDGGASDDSYEGFPNFDAEILTAREIDAGSFLPYCDCQIGSANDTTITLQTQSSDCRLVPGKYFAQISHDSESTFNSTIFDVDADFGLLLFNSWENHKGVPDP